MKKAWTNEIELSNEQVDYLQLQGRSYGIDSYRIKVREGNRQFVSFSSEEIELANLKDLCKAGIPYLSKNVETENVEPVRNEPVRKLWTAEIELSDKQIKTINQSKRLSLGDYKYYRRRNGMLCVIFSSEDVKTAAFSELLRKGQPHI